VWLELKKRVIKAKVFCKNIYENQKLKIGVGKCNFLQWR
jgi:hypothetical protein